jgi:hypothetical protein
MHESQLPFRPKRETAFDQLHCSFQRFTWSDQQMEMIWHHDKLMQQIFFMQTIVMKDIDEEASHSVGLKDVALLKCRSGDEVATASGIPAAGSRHGGHLSG